MKTSENINELAAALAHVQGAMEPARMNATNPFLKNKYADLGAVIESVRELLSSNGLSYVQMPGTPPAELGPAIALTTRLMHSSGQWLEDTFIMIIPLDEKGKSIMQVAGSAISYARRYALSAMLGVVADEDTDGNGRNVTKNPPRGNKATAPTPAANGRGLHLDVGDEVVVKGNKDERSGTVIGDLGNGLYTVVIADGRELKVSADKLTLVD